MSSPISQPSPSVSIRPRRVTKWERLANEAIAYAGKWKARAQRAAAPDFSAVAWTGGECPLAPSLTPRWERAYARALFREQVNAWRNAWKDSPDVDTLRTFYRRARYDAFATFRHARNGSAF